MTRSLRQKIGVLTLIIVGSIASSFLGCKSNLPPVPPRGEPWQVFTQSNSPLLDNHINDIISDAEGRVWFATDNGASGYLNGSWTSLKDSLKAPISGSTVVTSMAEGRDRSLWFGLLGGGLVRFNRFSASTVWRRYNSPDIAYDVVLGVASEMFDPGEIWCTTLLGVSRYIPDLSDPDRGTWITYTVSYTPELTTNQVRTVALNPNDNSIWFGTQNTGVLVSASYDIGVRWATYYPHPDNIYPITSLAFDASNTVWFGTTQGAWSFDIKNGDWVPYTPESTNGELPPGPVNDVKTDFRNVRWFGTNAGLVRLSDTTWTTFTTDNSPLPSNMITALAYDRRGNLWIGTTNGVAEFNEEGIRN